MKVRTLDGRGLRSAGYTEFECHALIHAAGHCASGDTFQGVPTSANVVYQKSDDTFFVAAKDDDTVTVIRNSNGKTLTARIIQDNETKKETKTTKKTETKEKEMETTATAKMDQLQQVATAGNPAEMLTAAIQALAGGVTPAAIAALQEEVAALKDELSSLKGEKPCRTIEVKVGEKTNRVDGVLNPVFEDVVTLIAAKKNVYLYGPAGSGKNVLCGQVAEALGLKFYYQNTLLTKFD